MSHANAALPPRARLRLALLVVEAGWPVARVAERYDVSWPTAKRWAERYRQLGPAGMEDASSRPPLAERHTPAAGDGAAHPPKSGHSVVADSGYGTTVTGQQAAFTSRVASEPTNR